MGELTGDKGWLVCVEPDRRLSLALTFVVLVERGGETPLPTEVLLLGK